MQSDPFPTELPEVTVRKSLTPLIIEGSNPSSADLPEWRKENPSHLEPLKDSDPFPAACEGCAKVFLLSFEAML